VERARCRAGIQSYRIEGGKLVETWIPMRPLGTSWMDVAQQRWTGSKQQWHRETCRLWREADLVLPPQLKFTDH
jgi:hypothetical protein